jgi:multiple sugar transport system permease protein
MLFGTKAIKRENNSLTPTTKNSKPLQSKMKLREWRDGWLFASPFVVGFLLFWLGPMVYSLFIVTQDWNLMRAPTFVGMANIYKLFKDPLLVTSLRATAIYTFVGVPLQVIFALLLALALNTRIKGRVAYRTIFFLPTIVPMVAVALGWLSIFYPSGGLINYYFNLDVRWLLIPRFAVPALIIMSLWTIGTQLVICLAGLQNIPKELEDAAQVDGANDWQRFIHITIPMISPILLYLLIIGIINSFQVFAIALVMTNGGPQNSTLFMVLYTYTLGFKRFNMGYAATVAWLLFVTIMAFTIVQFKLADKWVYYESEK